MYPHIQASQPDLGDDAGRSTRNQPADTMVVGNGSLASAVAQSRKAPASSRHHLGTAGASDGSVARCGARSDDPGSQGRACEGDRARCGEHQDRDIGLARVTPARVPARAARQALIGRQGAANERRIARAIPCQGSARGSAPSPAPPCRTLPFLHDKFRRAVLKHGWLTKKRLANRAPRFAIQERSAAGRSAHAGGQLNEPGASLRRIRMQ